MNSTLINNIRWDMISYYQGDPKRIQHFLKVFDFSGIISDGEMPDNESRDIILVTALMHDIGIKKAEEIYKSSSGKYQEELGPELAEKILEKYDVSPDFINKVKYIIGHHHTYNNIDAIEYQIIVEADFLVNAYEDNLSKESTASVYNKIFRTKTGKRLMVTIYNI